VGFFRLTTPVLWFFKFTFASNAATIVGGCLATNRYKLRLPAAFISAFLISGIVHPLITLLIWSDHCNSLSPYRFCQNRNNSCLFSCYETEELSFIPDKLYMLDFAGGGAVHLVGGVAGLVVCCFAKLQHWRDNRKKSSSTELGDYKDVEDTYQPRNFIEWMYPPNGGSERVGEAALGVIILWFCWFAFNCGSTDSLESVMATNGISSDFLLDYSILPFHDIPSIIAVNMILASATGGILAVFIASWAQLYTRAVSVNANEIANGILASLVAITAGCPFVDYWGACFIGCKLTLGGLIGEEEDVLSVDERLLHNDLSLRVMLTSDAMLSVVDLLVSCL
jgi:Amt family ammonium transporter